MSYRRPLHLTIVATFLVLFGVPGLSAGQQVPEEEETVHFTGFIASVEGEFSPETLRVGDKITGSFTFNPEVTDTNRNRKKGQFPDALIRLSITMERNGALTFHGTWGEGSISTDHSDATDPDAPGMVQDQVSMASNVPIDVASVQGNRPDLVFLQIAQRGPPLSQPGFLTNDSIPVDISLYNRGELRLGSLSLGSNHFGPGFRTILVFTPRP